MFNSLHALKKGTNNQRLAYEAIQNLNILEDLIQYEPAICGTIPIGMDTNLSDIDVIMEVYNLEKWENKIRYLYGELSDFTFTRKMIRGLQIGKANFTFQNFEFELFGQSQPVLQQNAYLHMIIEYEILKQYPDFKKEVIRLKQKGFNTEAAFCHLLGLTGDPFEELIKYGKDKGYISY